MAEHKESKLEWQWERASRWEDIEEIMTIVEPASNIYDKQGIVKRYPDHYRAYMGRRNGEKETNAIAVAAWLPKTKTLHIETFGLHPRIRGQHQSYDAWNSWMTFIRQEWPVTQEAKQSLMIEVYLKNVIVWHKVMGVEQVKTSKEALFLSPETPIVLMVRDLTRPVDEVYDEWQQFQLNWHLDLDRESKKF